MGLNNVNEPAKDGPRADKRVIVRFPNGREEVVVAGDVIPDGVKIVGKDDAPQSVSDTAVRTAEVKEPRRQGAKRAPRKA